MASRWRWRPDREARPGFGIEGGGAVDVEAATRRDDLSGLPSPSRRATAASAALRRCDREMPSTAPRHTVSAIRSGGRRNNTTALISCAQLDAVAMKLLSVISVMFGMTQPDIWYVAFGRDKTVKTDDSADERGPLDPHVQIRNRRQSCSPCRSWRRAGRPVPARSTRISPSRSSALPRSSAGPTRAAAVKLCSPDGALAKSGPYIGGFPDCANAHTRDPSASSGLRS